MHNIDTSFREKKLAAAKRRHSMRLFRLAGAAGVLIACAVGVGIWLTADKWTIEGLDNDLVEVDTGETDADVPVFIPAVVDLAGDPMTISIGSDSSQARRVREVPKPADLVEPGIPERIEVLSDVMLSTSESLMTTIPSSPEDFAFFQAQRTVHAPASPVVEEPSPQDGVLPEPSGAAPPASSGPETPMDEAAFSDPAAGWGETISDGEEDLPAFRRNRIENNTMVATVTPESQRAAATEDFVDKVLGARTLDSLVLEHRFSAGDAKAAGEAMKTLFGKDQLDAGYVVAMRGLMTGGKQPGPSLVQVSVYADAQYIGTLARADDGKFVAGTDPWVREDLLHYSGAEEQTGPQRQYRLLDAIYSTAVRNSVPTSVIGEAIMFLSRGQDLNAFATQGDRLVLVYSANGRAAEGSSGRVLYAAVHGDQKNIECFVFRPSGSDDFACVTEEDQVYSLTVTNGMVTPVNGVMTSTFGPRKHPILGTVRVHKGVDWAAPVGTPVFAAFDGTIAYFGDGEGYGNVVRVIHSGGRETRYAHLSRFAANLSAGMAVKAGDVVGYVGTTGLSTGPHLHFELYAGAEAINPLETPAIAVAAGTGDAAVELLVDRIIRVESGGSATAKNPLSTATGLGQFIESTWIRMINTYRPDLARSLSRADVLALRFDPTISREMVRRLAQEGEAYLRARGHEITAGRLYLCHFLGMEGASTVLSSADGEQLVVVLGQSVISANPFLTGRDVSYIKAWAEAKMRGRGAPAPAAPVVETRNIAKSSPEFVAYKTAITALLAAIATQDQT
ncbi:peptidoglycan DD-metalloendopeptidase family protein [Mesorhizobium sp. LHD-90]|uniref:peptidoglycan DD-metalloendopeptidase family protein n=1 Tax=Mesorhizobium sp. LHD-90 TaxID=3071414 RepID=UPI0027E0C5EA|nr:peptidoglycan DD-metalloendopeptidase family protein [Mesorhizobium sp. LHD-90]MDQ6434707.1 peptidoglycan DD-metalloendopeptidase family protein [Mesorhizobium sp. LHD-90]